MPYVIIGNTIKGIKIIHINKVINEHNFYIDLWKNRYNININNNNDSNTHNDIKQYLNI